MPIRLHTKCCICRRQILPSENHTASNDNSLASKLETKGHDKEPPDTFSKLRLKLNLRSGRIRRQEGIVPPVGFGSEERSEGVETRRTTKLVRVKPGFIECLLKGRPPRPFPAWSVENIDELYRDEPELGESVRSAWARAAALAKKLQEEDDPILEQYRAKGYVEVEDDEEGMTKGNQGKEQSKR